MKKFQVMILLLLCQLISTAVHAVELLVVANSKHISMVVPMASVPDSFLPKDLNYRSFEYLDLSMGQDPYFYKKNPTTLDGLRAFFNSPSVIRLHPFSGSPRVNYPKKSILTLNVSESQLKQLLDYVRSDISEDTKAIARDEVARKYFYKAKSTYSFFNTCVTWMVKGLKLSGLNLRLEKIADYSTMDAFNEIAAIREMKSIFRYEEAK